MWGEGGGFGLDPSSICWVDPLRIPRSLLHVLNPLLWIRSRCSGRKFDKLILFCILSFIPLFFSFVLEGYQYWRAREKKMVRDEGVGSLNFLVQCMSGSSSKSDGRELTWDRSSRLRRHYLVWEMCFLYIVWVYICKVYVIYPFSSNFTYFSDVYIYVYIMFCVCCHFFLNAMTVFGLCLRTYLCT